ncbi:MAG TPA: hypothetical protein VML55_02125 [Planctomycetaceae bacterium]|nr:hypothetical protein [Planctomycetaceae bacterium]
MVTLTKDFTMTRPSRNRDPRTLDLRGSYFADDLSDGRVRCRLQIGRMNVPVEIPAEVLERHQMFEAVDIVLHVPGEKLLPVETAALLSEAQQRVADRWIAEMRDFDRF